MNLSSANLDISAPFSPLEVSLQFHNFLEFGHFLEWTKYTHVEDYLGSLGCPRSKNSRKNEVDYTHVEDICTIKRE